MKISSLRQMYQRLSLSLKLKIPSVIFLIFIYAISLPANSEIDSLSNLLNNYSADTNRVKILNELSFLLIDINSVKSKEYAIEACSLAQELDYLKGIGDCKVRLGILAEIKGDFPKAINFYAEALDIRKKHFDVVPIASIYNNIGLCELYQNNFDEAIKVFNEGLKILNKESIPPNRVKAGLFGNLSDAYKYKGAFNLAIVHSDSSLLIWKKLKSHNDFANNLLSKSDLYLRLENWDNAQKTLQESLKIFVNEKNKNGQARCFLGLGNIYFKTKKYELAHHNYTLANELKEYINLTDQANLFYNFGSIYKNKTEYKQALKNYQVSLELYESLNANYDIATIYYEMGNIHKLKKNYDLAKSYLLKGLSYYKEEYDIFDKTQMFYSLSDVYNKLNQNDSAFYFNNQYNSLRDSIYSNKINAVNLQHNLEKEQKEKAIIKADNIAIEKASQRKNYLIAILALGGLFLSAILYGHYNRQKMKNAYLEIDDLLQEQELAIAYARLDEKDTTQKQIGQDLHDSLGALLATIKLYFNDFSEKLNTLTEDTSHNQQKTFELLDEAVSEVRRISHNMQSGVLKNFGLIEAVKQLAGRINDSNQLKVKVYTHGFKERIPSNLEFKLYKIIQELVGNALKHSKANKLTISINKQEELLNLMVEDNGIGFQPELVGDKVGIGLKNITYRITELEGTCHFDSTKGRGTNVIIDIPIKDNGFLDSNHLKN